MRSWLVSSFVSVWLVSCRPSIDKLLAAQYKDQMLTQEEALQRLAVPAGADTLAMIRKYAMEWIREQALAETAYVLLPALRPQIEAQTRAYQNKLLILYLSRLLLEEGPYKEVPDSVIQRFYQAQAQAFRALEALYKWRWVQVPATWTAQMEARQRAAVSDSVWLAWLREKQYRGGVQNQWSTAVDSLQPFFPVRLSDLPVQGTAQVQRVEGGQTYWLIFQLTGKILAGQILPYELAKNPIRRILVQQEAEARIDSFREAVYKQALSHPEVRVF